MAISRSLWGRPSIDQRSWLQQPTAADASSATARVPATVGSTPVFFHHRCLITVTMDLAVVAAAQRDGELIADLAAKRPRCANAQVMGIAGLAAANQARLFGHEPTWSLSRTRRGSGNASALLSMPLTGSVACAVTADVAGPCCPAVSPSLPTERHEERRHPQCPFERRQLWYGTPSSTRAASAAVKLFFAAMTRCAQRAAASRSHSFLVGQVESRLSGRLVRRQWLPECDRSSFTGAVT